MASPSDALAQDAGANLIQFLRLTFTNFEREPSGAARDGLLESVGVAYSAIEDLLHRAIVARDTHTFLAVDQEWQEVAEDPTWLWEDEEPEPAPLVQLSRARAVTRLALAMWTLHTIRDTPDADRRAPLQEIVLALNGHFESVDLLFLVLDWAIEASQERGSQWTSWFLAEKPIRKGYFIPTTEELIHVTVLLATMKMSDPETVKPRSWMRGRAQDISAAVIAVQQEGELWEALLPDSHRPSLGIPGARPTSEFGRRVEWVKTALDAAQQALSAEEDEAIRHAEPSPDKEREFLDEILRRFDAGHPVRPLLRRRDAVRLRRDEPPADEAGTIVFYVGKDLLEEGGTLGLEFIAADVARQLAVLEVERFLAALPQTPIREPGGPIASDITQQAEAVREAGFVPDLVLGPTTWAFKSKAGITALSDEEREELAGSPIPGVIGRIDDAFAFGNPSVRGEVIVVDTAHAVVWEEWPTADGALLDIRIEFLDADSSRREAARLYPQARQAEITDETNELEKQALVQVTQLYSISPGDLDAVRRIAFVNAQ